MLSPQEHMLSLRWHILFIASLLLFSCAKPPTWGTRYPADSELCVDCRERIPKEAGFSVVTTQDSVFFVQTNATEYLKKVFDKRRDGMALEIVAYPPYACDNDSFFIEPARRNKNYQLNGTLLQPVYKKQLFDPWKKMRKDSIRSIKARIKSYKGVPSVQAALKDRLKKARKGEIEYPEVGIPMGTFSPPSDGRYEINLVYLQKKEICRVRHLPDLDYEGYTEFEPMPPLGVFPEGKGKLKRLDTVSCLVPFERGSHELQPGLLDDCIESLKMGRDQIKAVYIYAYASVEGGFSLNDCLQCQRGKVIERKLRPLVPTGGKIPVQIRTETRWDLFYEQMAKKLGREPERNDSLWTERLKDPELLKELEPLLEEQRIARADLIFERPMTRSEQASDALALLHQAIDKTIREDGKVDYGQVDQALMQQSRLRDYIAMSDSNVWVLEEMKIPQSPVFGQLHINAYLMRSIWGSEKEMAKQKRRLRLLMMSFMDMEPKGRVWPYNYHILTVNGMGVDGYLHRRVDLSDVFSSMRRWEPRKPQLEGVDYRRLWKNFHFQAATILIEQGSMSYQDRKILNNSLEWVHRYYKDSVLTDARTLSLAGLFMGGDRPELAYDMLSPVVKLYLSGTRPMNTEVLWLYVKLAYSHPDDMPEAEGCEWLMLARDWVEPAEWCQLFNPQGGVEFQSLDCKEVREAYCETCQDNLDVIKNNPARYAPGRVR